jgi:hypothetical protein
MRSKTSPLFKQYVEDGLQKGEYVLQHRNGQEIPIDYIAKVFPYGCMVARWDPKKLEPKRTAA